MITYDRCELFAARGGGKGPEYEYSDCSCRVYVKFHLVELPLYSVSYRSVVMTRYCTDVGLIMKEGRRTGW